MPAAGAADGNDKLILPFLDVIGDQKRDHILQLLLEFHRLRIGHDKILHRLVISGLPLQFINIIRIRKEAHVKNQIRIRRNPVLEAEGRDRNHQRIVFLVLLENPDQLLLQLSRQKSRGIDDIVCMCLDILQDFPLRPDSVLDSSVRCKRMSAAAFLIPLDQSLITGVHEKNLIRISLSAKCAEDLLHIGEGLVCANIKPEDNLCDFIPRHEDKLHEFIN